MSNGKYNSIIVDQQEGIARLTLNRPEKLNAMTGETYQELEEAITTLEGDPSFRVLIITGAGQAFCAGGDIGQLLEASKSVEAARKRLLMSHGVAAHLKRLKQPVITSINGDAIGAGCSVALMGDLRIASDKARFGLTFTRVGLSLDMGVMYHLVHSVGANKAMELAFLADIIDAKEAERIGMVNKVVPHADLDTAVQGWATKLARAPALSIGLMKPAIYKAQISDFFSDLDNEINIQTLCLTSHDGKEGLTAFTEKRRPVFGQE
jgi:2-(1,2-epoxy-1,2-dihydrophenyl)acetyl-CoA isomerase